MKRLDNSDSLSGLISICHSSADEKISGGGKNIYSTRGFQSMLDGLDEEDCVEETGHFSEKKRRLNIEQVKALEKNFEVENKLEPDRKVKLAQELGLQPRQVAIWFQNRRARWKTKQLERDYGVLKSNFDSLKANFDALQNDKEALLAELKELKSKLQEENTESLNPPLIKEEILMMDSENQVLDQMKNSSSSMVGGGTVSSETTDPNQDFSNNNNNNNNNSNNNNNDNGVLIGVSLYGDLKDGSSDSDSSAILNEDNNNNSPNNAAISSSSGVLQQQKQNCSSINWFSESNREINSMNTQKHNYQHNYGQFLKMEEHNFFGAEEPAACSLFSDDQAPTLHWYCPDQWS